MYNLRRSNASCVGFRIRLVLPYCELIHLQVNFTTDPYILSNDYFVFDEWWTQVPGQKRPWYDIKEDTCKSMHSEDLDLNAPAGEVQVAQSGCYGGVSDGHVSPVGVHHTTGVSGYSSCSCISVALAPNWSLCILRKGLCYAYRTIRFLSCLEGY